MPLFPTGGGSLDADQPSGGLALGSDALVDGAVSNRAASTADLGIADQLDRQRGQPIEVGRRFGQGLLD